MSGVLEDARLRHVGVLHRRLQRFRLSLVLVETIDQWRVHGGARADGSVCVGSRRRRALDEWLVSEPTHTAEPTRVAAGASITVTDAVTVTVSDADAVTVTVTDACSARA